MCIQRGQTLKRFTLILPVLVALALVALLVARRGTDEAELPSFAPAQAPRFDPIEPPLGSARVRGRVVDAHGSAQAEASVFVAASSLSHWTFTDADGRFAFDELPPQGELEAIVLVWGRPPSSHRIASGEVELTLVVPDPLPSAPRLDDIALVSIRGRVVPAFGAAALDPSGYEVRILPVAAPDELGGALPRRTDTDADGAFALEGVALGKYRWQVLPGWARGGSWPDLHAGPEESFELRAEARDVVLELCDGALEGQVLDVAGRTIEGALALLTDAEEPARLWPPAVTDREGVFRVNALPAGRYLLVLQAGEGHSELNVAIEPGRVTRPELPALETRLER